MKILVLTVFLAIMQAAPPVPQQAPNTIRITELPPVSVTRDWIDKASLALSGLLFVVGVVGVCAAYRTLKAIETQSHIMQGQLIAMQRPKLEVKHVFIIPDQSITGRSEDGHNWKVGCLVANIGESKAEVIESDVNIPNLGIGSLGALIATDSVPRYERTHSFGAFVVQPGERQEKMVILDANSTEVRRMRDAHRVASIKATRDAYGQTGRDTSPIVCFGFFRYKDGNGVARVTGFSWQWNKKDMSFFRFNHPNYEYTD